MCWWHARSMDTLRTLIVTWPLMEMSAVMGQSKDAVLGAQQSPCACLDVHAEDGSVLRHREGGSVI